MSWDWEIVGLTEDGAVRGIVLSRAGLAGILAGIGPTIANELFWVEVDALPQASGYYRVRTRGRGGASFVGLDEAARYAAMLICTKLERWR